MSDILNWVFWSLGVCVVVVAIFVGIAWVIFWVTNTITEANRQKTAIADRFYTCQRWFSGFKDLDIIWDYILGKTGDIDSVRDHYARFRNTDVYGKPAHKAEREGIKECT